MQLLMDINLFKYVFTQVKNFFLSAHGEMVSVSVIILKLIIMCQSSKELNLKISILMDTLLAYMAG